MNKYDEAIRIWLARRAGTYQGKFYTADQISEIEFGEDGGYWYSSYTNEPDKMSIRYKINGKPEYILIEDISFSVIIEECMKIYNEVLKHIR